MVRTRSWWLLAFLACTTAADTARETRIAFDTDTITGPGISVAGVKTRLRWPDGPLELTIARLQLGDRAPFARIRLDCPEFTLDANGFGVSCERGKLSFDHPLASPRDMPVSLRWRPGDGGDVRLANVPLAGEEVIANVTRDEQAWSVEIATSGTDLGAIAGVLPLAGIELNGRADVQAAVDISAATLKRIELTIEHEATRFSDATARFLGEGLKGQIDLMLEDTGERWQGTIDGRWSDGELLTPAAYLEATPSSPLVVSARLAADHRGTTVELDAVHLAQRPWVALEGRAELNLGSPPSLRRLEARVANMDAGALYARYLLPVVVHPILAALELSGRVGGRIVVEDGSLARLQIELEDLFVTAETEQASFAIEGLTSKVGFGRGTEQNGYLSWQSARLAQFGIGSARVPLAFSHKRVATRTPVNIPLMDGGLEIEGFSLDWNRTPPDITFDALLLPMSMEKVTTALGWIPMQGQLSGVVPRVAISAGGLQVGGNLLVRVFDGNVVIRNLKISDLFGYWPVLTADAECQKLDLEMLTGTYEFGRITGRIDGVVKGLRLENWRPTAFDARFETTPGDRSPHRISQRAVDNITSLSGGASGAVSRTFLRFFDEFNYDRLGIACRLHNGVCQMDGVEAAANGYYLVRGGGIPRIDVIGFNRSTDWDQLVDRLIAIAESGPPIIE